MTMQGHARTQKEIEADIYREGFADGRAAMLAELENPTPELIADISDEELLRRAVRSARAKSRGFQPRWVAVMERFELGSTYARQLCRRFDFNPDEQVRP
jgi:hypothetical protein